MGYMSKLAHKLMVGYLRNLTLADGTEYGLPAKLSTTADD